MGVTRERFAEGLTYEEFKAQMTRNRERFEETERTVTLAPDDVAFFQGLEHPYNVLVIAEDWCGDVINNLPILGRLAAESDKLNVRVFLRDQNLDIMDQFLKNGEFRSIPVFVVFDEKFNEVGHFIERPASVTARSQQFRADLFANDPILSNYSPATSISELPDDVRQHYSNANARFREEIRAFSDREVVREIRALFGQAPAVTQSEAAPTRAMTTGSPTRIVTQAEAAPGQAALRGATTQPTTGGAVDVRITYCAECGYEPQTLELTGALMREFVNDLGSITLIPWHDGAFDVVVDGDLVHSMYRDGGFPQSQAIIEAVRARMNA